MCVNVALMSSLYILCRNSLTGLEHISDLGSQLRDLWFFSKLVLIRCYLLVGVTLTCPFLMTMMCFESEIGVCLTWSTSE